jgi:hypothetical protein
VLLFVDVCRVDRMSHEHETNLCVAGYVGAVLCVLTAAGCSQRVPLANVSSQAAEALKTAFPDASMEQVDSEYKNGVGIYEARLARATK